MPLEHKVLIIILVSIFIGPMIEIVLSSIEQVKERTHNKIFRKI